MTEEHETAETFWVLGKVKIIMLTNLKYFTFDFGYKKYLFE